MGLGILVLFISHRGNLRGAEPCNENSPDFIDNAINSDLVVEVDLIYERNLLYLGHDSPQYHITPSWLQERSTYLLIHAKNTEAFSYLQNFQQTYHYFWHDSDHHTFTSQGLALTLAGHMPSKGTIYMLPEYDRDFITKAHSPNFWNLCSGVCTDFPIPLRSIWQSLT